jgi:CubicO group peptidase (beta-lactamase class C family)
MRQYLLIGCTFLTGFLGPLPVRADESAAAADQAVAALVKVFNAGTPEEFYRLFSAKGQKAISLPQATVALLQVRSRFGKISGAATLAKTEGQMRYYQAEAEKGQLVCKVIVDGEGRFDALRVQPAFLALLPDGPLSLEEVQQRLGKAIEQTMTNFQVPSISLALVKDDRVVWAQAFGYLNVAKKVPADTETVYVTGSIFKVVVATAVMQLVDEGKLDLDMPVNRYLKDFQIPNPYDSELVMAAFGSSTVGLLGSEGYGPLLAACAVCPDRTRATPLTMRHLLSHRGGWPNPTEFRPLWGRKLPTSLEELIRTQARVVTRPGQKIEYSNLAFAFNGYLIGQVSGQSFEAAMQKRLFDPLDMTRTAFDPTPAVTENLAIPYQFGGPGKGLQALPYIRIGVYPAGEVYATPSDLARFLILHLNEGRYKGAQIVSSQAIAEMARVQFGAKGETSGFGLGWYTQRDNGRQLLAHDGQVPGFRTIMLADRGKRVAAVLFTNKTANVVENLSQSYAEPLPVLAQYAIELLDRMK